MTSKVHVIAQEASQLERHERVEVIEKLLETLESAPSEEPSEIEAVWGNEVRRRADDLKTGDVKSISWNQVRVEGEKLFDGD